MLPISDQLPAAVVVAVFGLMACVAGYRLLRYVLAVFGFIIGGWRPAPCSAPAKRPTWSGFIAGGAVGAIIMVAAAFIGVALVGAGLGAAAATLSGPSRPAIPIPTSSSSPRWRARGSPPGCSATSPSWPRRLPAPGRCSWADSRSPATRPGWRRRPRATSGCPIPCSRHRAKRGCRGRGWARVLGVLMQLKVMGGGRGRVVKAKKA